ncbi:hypothetical protein SESBI_23691 [Sesbania bispinosa]|nr:hypothetical protein SESBI_23691 [Sesbania bispinosa]
MASKEPITQHPSMPLIPSQMKRPLFIANNYASMILPCPQQLEKPHNQLPPESCKTPSAPITPKAC